MCPAQVSENPGNSLVAIKKRWQAKAAREGLTYKEARRLANEEERRLMRLEQLKTAQMQSERRRMNTMYSNVWQFAEFSIE